MGAKPEICYAPAVAFPTEFRLAIMLRRAGYFRIPTIDRMIETPAFERLLGNAHTGTRPPPTRQSLRI